MPTSVYLRSNGPLERHPIIIKKGAIVDASVIETPLKPKGKVHHYKVTADSGEQKEACVKKDYKVSVD